MRKVDAITYFGSVGALAEKLGITGAAVSQWGDDIPVRRAYEIERMTNGALRVDSQSALKSAA